MIRNPFATDIEEIIHELQTDPEQGLGQEEIVKRLKTYGPNALKPIEPKKWWVIMAGQFLDPIIYILLIATALAIFYGSMVEAVAILVVILLTVAIGFFMELQAVRSLESLSKMGQQETTVMRSGKILRIPTTGLVPGDLIILESGDLVPADARVCFSENLETKEAMLTGESTSVHKSSATLPEGVPVSDQKNMVFRETVIASGIGRAIVVATGMETELGKIQEMAEEAVESRTPLEKKLSNLGKKLIWLTLFLAVLIVISGYLRGEDFLVMLETGIALAVAAIPEGLPIVATIALARGMLRLSKQQVIIKKIEAVETLGAVNILCTDKTGTLTEDDMKVRTLVLAGKHGPEEQDFSGEKPYSPYEGKKSLELMILNGILCNAVALEAETRRGDPMDLALLEFAEAMGYHPLAARRNHPKVLELPFDTERKLMATLNENEDSGYTIYVKGAFENVLPRCTHILIDGQARELDQTAQWENLVDKLASQGLRTLAMAYRPTDRQPAKESLPSELTFLGILGFIDPARTDVKQTIETYKKAGIQVVMMTGDHPGTAGRIARDIGLLDDFPTGEQLMKGSEMPDLSSTGDATTARLLKTVVFARVTPRQKLELVEFYQQHHNTIGMMGDGVNDVPALKKSDIGIAMGIRGTQAARAAADVILKNDRFTAMELAIRQGRLIFEHIRQFVVYLLSSNLAEILSVGAAALMGLPAPLLPLQILFLNLVTDVFPALALGTGKGDSNLMQQPPRAAAEPIMTRKHWVATIVYGLCITLAVLGVVAWSYYVMELPAREINNLAFYTLVLGQLLNVFNVSRRDLPFFVNEVTKNPWIWGAIAICIAITALAYFVPPMARALSLVPITWGQLMYVFIFGLASLLLAQFLKRTGISP